MTPDPAEFRIRPSSLVVWADCPRRWAARHLPHLINQAGYRLAPARPTHVGAAVGSGVHAGAGYTMESKRTTGELGNASEAEDRAIAEMKLRLEYGVLWDQTTDNLSTGQRQVARMVRAYRSHLAPKIEPLLVEDRLEADIGDGWTLSGQPDTMAGDPDRDLRDLKTGTTRRANMVQYGAYFMLLDAHGYRPTGIFEDFLQRVRINKEQPPPVSVHLPIREALADAWELVEDIKARTALFIQRATEATSQRPPASAFRANPSTSMCGPKWCSAWGTSFCKAHRGEIAT